MVTPREVQAEAATAARRAELLASGWPTTRELSNQLQLDPERITQLRMTSQILGAWDHLARTYRYPSCQFDGRGVLPVVPRLLGRLQRQADDPSGWRRTFWLHGPREGLENRAPADLLHSAPERVLALAEYDFESHE